MLQKTFPKQTPSIGETADLFASAVSSTATASLPTPLTASVASGTAAEQSQPIATGPTRLRVPVDHLAAARKLQWRLRKARAYSAEEVKTGRLICRHLLALLNEANAEPVNHSPLPQQA